MEADIKQDQVWKLIFKVFPIIKGSQLLNPVEVVHYDSLALIQKHGSVQMIKDIIIKQLERVMPSVADTFWSFFPPYADATPTNQVPNGAQLFIDAVNALHSTVSLYQQQMELLQALMKMDKKTNLPFQAADATDLLKIILRATLHSRLDDFDTVIVKEFYRASFKVFLHIDCEEEITCGGCDNVTDHCTCQEIMTTFQDINSKLMDLGLLERITGEILTDLIHERIENHVKETCKGSFYISYLDSLENWLRTVVIGWLRHVYTGETESSETTVKVFEQKLMHSVYDTYTKTRIEQLFNIIIEYPDSQPAIEDLRICIEKTDLRSELTSRLQRALVTRLLHPGVNTGDVIAAYVSAIKALRQLDPTGVLLETVTHPIRFYLRNREDTVKCIINNLIDDGPSELAEELVKGEKSPLCEGAYTEEDVENWQEWVPDPIDADSTKPSRSRKTSDVISMLVNVYGSKDLFVKEYTTLLAERLLAASNYDTEKEYRYLELLKLRFGESELHSCEVMLKDIYDSKRINAHVVDNEPEFPVSAKILSAPFWPAFKEETLELPEFINDQLETFTKAFEKQKGNRTLCWKPHLGSVQLEIEFSDRVLQITTTPTRAAVLWNFQTKNEWTVDDLSSAIKVPPMKLRREIGFWQAQGVLKEVSTDRYVLIEDGGGKGKSNMAFEGGCEDEEVESVMASTQDQREEELTVFWSYIVGMLTNLESMPIDRIHQMLKMFASQGPTSMDCNQVELQAFLDRKVREHKLMLSGGLYRLPKL